MTRRLSSHIGRGTRAVAFVTALAISGCSSDGGGASGPAGAPAGVQIVAGDGQTVLVGTQVPIRPRVQVVDAAGRPISGVAVTFTVQAGGGSLVDSAGTTNVNGEFNVGSWIVGQTPGSNTVVATLDDDPDIPAASFTATAATSLFSVTLDFLTPLSASQTAAFNSAAARWSSLIIGDLSFVDFTQGPVPAGVCGVPHPSFSGTIDDILIWVEVTSIDGPGGILGAAGPCFVRPSIPALPAIGVMRFDSADLAAIEANGTLEDVILHEMAHALGFGTMWDFGFSFLANPSCPGSIGPACSPDNAGADTHFTGGRALAAFDALPGGPWMPPTAASSKVPVENIQGGPGTRDGHWRETTFVDELMTGFVNPAPNPLSAVTVAQFGDLGYAVDMTGADPYTLGDANGVRAPVSGSQVTLELKNDIWRGPVFTTRSGPSREMIRIR